MSLILEALRKLEREKRAPERGLLVVAAAPWPARRRRAWTVAAAGLAAAAATLATAAALRFWPTTAPPTSIAPAATGAIPKPAATLPRAVIAPEVAAYLPAPPRSTIASTGAATPAPSGAPSDDQANAGAGTPDAPAAPAADAEAEVRLHAISEQDGQPVAILNDRLVREGDTFDGMRVVRIGAAEVEIEVAGRRRVLKF